MTEDYDIDYDYDNAYEDWRYEDDGFEYLDCDENYCKFSTGWDYPVYWISLELEDGDYLYARFFYFETTRLEIGNKKGPLLKLDSSNFDRDYFLIYDGEKISPKSREHFRSTIDILVKLKNFL